MRVLSHILVLSAFFFMIRVYAQPPDLKWASQFKTDDQVSPRGILTDNRKYSYITGVFKSSVDFDPGSGIKLLTGGGSFLCKLDSEGLLAWVMQFGKSVSVTSISYDLDSNILICGGAERKNDFDPGPGTFELDDNSSYGFLLTLDRDGNFISVLKISFLVQIVITDDAGNIYLAGFGPADKDMDPGPGVYYSYEDVFGGKLIKLDRYQNFIWGRTFPGLGIDVKAMLIDSYQNIYIGGTFWRMDFDPGVNQKKITAQRTDIYLVSLDKNGGFRWVDQIGGESHYDDLLGMKLNKEGKLIVTGLFWKTVDFDPGPGENFLTAVGGEDAFIAEFTTDGELNWVKRTTGGHCSGFDIDLDKDDNIYIVGKYYDKVNFDPNSTLFQPDSIGPVSGFVSKYDPDGNIIWLAPLECWSGSIGMHSDIYLNVFDSDNIFVVSRLNGIADFDPGQYHRFYETQPGAFDGFVLKLGPPEADLCVDTTICKGDSVLISSPYSRYRYPHLWNTGSTDSFIYAKKNQTYYLSVQFDGRNYTDSMKLSYYPAPKLYVGPDTAFCGAFSYRVDAEGDHFGRYSWNTGDSIEYTIVKERGMYYVKVKDSFDCPASDTMFLDTLKPPEIQLTPDTFLCNHGVIAINVDQYESGFNYLWSTGETTSGIQITDTGWYSITVSRPFCEVADSIHVREFCPPIPKVYIPSAFSPNGDELNDRFKPVYFNVTRVQITIYNRWGQQVFTISDLDQSWDGTYKGLPATQGVYMYYISYGDDQRVYSRAGSLTLLR